MLQDTHTHLGNKVLSPTIYAPEMLHAIARGNTRRFLPSNICFYGHDIWNCYEVSWLDLTGKPHVGVLEMTVPCGSEYLIESKSFKLYLASLCNVQFEAKVDVEQLISRDLSNILKAAISCKLFTLDSPMLQDVSCGFAKAILIDTLDVPCNEFLPNKNLLVAKDNNVSGVRLYSNLLKSNCPVTAQPDWASILVEYSGLEICSKGLLQYIVSYRNHTGFHEDCVEKIFCDIYERCNPSSLLVHARYTRRGGIDINPLRASFVPKQVENKRLVRQ